MVVVPDLALLKRKAFHYQTADRVAAPRTTRSDAAATGLGVGFVGFVVATCWWHCKLQPL